ncbi:ABC transporter ATP-binding protein [Mesorhizobium sp. UC22_110]|uniref:ABC transporter ATP-binding protein n=1 Tax=Mesorhizobium sp. UC22_110 TaxID=3374552 RepID=UPI00375647FE
MAASIELRNITKAYGDVKVIHGVDLSIEPGEFTVFVGPSGCGKSTLLRLIAGLERITGGDLLIDSRRINEVPASKRGIAMVFQSYALYPHMSVRKNLSFGLETIGTPKAEIASRVAKAAEILRITPLLDRRPKALSGGQRQRVAIGRAIVREPRIFLFDEPLSNLDAELRVQMRVEIAKLHNDLGNTMIYVTHDQVEAMTMADKIVVLRSGVVEQVGAPLDLYNRPRNLFVAGFIGSPKMNLLTAGSKRQAPAGGRQCLVAVPRDSGRDDTGRTARAYRHHRQRGRQAGGRQGGADRKAWAGRPCVYATTTDGQAMTVALNGQRQVEVGTSIPVYIDPARIHLFAANGNALPEA